VNIYLAASARIRLIELLKQTWKKKKTKNQLLIIINYHLLIINNQNEASFGKSSFNHHRSTSNSLINPIINLNQQRINQSNHQSKIISSINHQSLLIIHHSLINPHLLTFADKKATTSWKLCGSFFEGQSRKHTVKGVRPIFVCKTSVLFRNRITSTPTKNVLFTTVEQTELQTKYYLFLCSHLC
jgi:hypothetical protein